MRQFRMTQLAKWLESPAKTDQPGHLYSIGSYKPKAKTESQIKVVVWVCDLQTFETFKVISSTVSESIYTDPKTKSFN